MLRTIPKVNEVWDTWFYSRFGKVTAQWLVYKKGNLINHRGPDEAMDSYAMVN